MDDDDNPHVLMFLEHVYYTCAEYGVALHIEDTKHFFVDGKKAHAFFEPPHPGKPRGRIGIVRSSMYKHWLEQLVHEFGHFEQWRQQSPIWRRDMRVHNHVAKLIARGELVSMKEMLRLYRAKRALELDCERNAVRLIRIWHLPRDAGSYIQSANMHIWSYSLQIELLMEGIMPKGKQVLFHRHLAERCPKKFLQNYDDVPDFLRESARRRT